MTTTPPRVSRCDYDDPAARADMVDSLARDLATSLMVLDGRELDEAVDQAGALIATVLGQDLDRDEAGMFRVARRVARDWVISTVDSGANTGGAGGRAATKPIPPDDAATGSAGEASRTVPRARRFGRRPGHGRVR